ncbi:hypothetical protein [Halosimplex pelagicum]|uniref:Uncharacterized protein n=1 Tax=Halosimplex pelagicum TaxID=869886 RepID=A0A7D5SU38_9EURY|nr:hypothetical protein [Halosimplex pelagicum]QLH80987.1 hypothetical protein HZS54_04755 [Halosimplex pelagicum]
MDDAELWREVGRKSAASELDEARFGVEEALYDILMNTMYQGGDPTPEQIRDARMALNLAYRILETRIAPIAGCEPWGGPLPDIPSGKARETYHLGSSDE